MCQSFVLLPVFASPFFPSDYSASMAPTSDLLLSSSRPTCSNHSLATDTPGCCSVSRQISNIVQVAIYWNMVFCHRRTYIFISSSPAASISASKGWYAHCPSVSQYGCIPNKQWATLWWKLPRVRSILGSSPRSLIQTRGSHVLPPCEMCRVFGSLTPSRPESTMKSSIVWDFFLRWVWILGVSLSRKMLFSQIHWHPFFFFLSFGPASNVPKLTHYGVV